MDVKVTLNTRRVVILSAGFILFGFTVFFIGMLVGAKARPPEAPPKMEQARADGEKLAEKIPPKVPDLKVPPVEGDAEKLPDFITKEKDAELDAKKAEIRDTLAVSGLDAKTTEVKDKLAVPDLEAKKAEAEKIKEVDVKKEVAGLVPPDLKDKAAVEPKTAPALLSKMTSKDKKSEEKPDVSKETVKKPETKADAQKPEADESMEPQKSTGAFTVQVGAFLEKANAEVLLQNLRKRGYTPYIYSIWDDMKRQWHTVRLGNYEDQESASKSAAEFTKKEKMPSSVRGVGVL